jgi:hypothetical protein
MKKLTISVDDGLAEAGPSREEADERRSRRLEALEKIFAGPKWKVMENGRMPTADERNARR